MTATSPPPSAPARAGPAPSSAFISYAREDVAFVRRVHERLTADGRDVWVDLEDIPPTAEWRAEIESGIASSDAVIAVLSPDWASSEVCRSELGTALRLGKRIVPVVRRDVDGATLPPEVAARNWIFMREADPFEPALATLDEALDTDLDHLHAHTRLLVRAAEWDRRDRDRSLLLRGSDLREAEAWLAAAPGQEPAPTALQSQYVLAGRTAAARRQRIGVGVAVVVVAITSALAVLAWIQRSTAIHEANVASSRERAAQADARLPFDPTESRSLAAAGLARAPTQEARDALDEATLRSRLLRRLVGHTAPVNAVAWSPEGRRVATASDDDTAGVWDAVSGRRTGTLRHRDDVNAVAWSPDGRRLATASADGTAALWDPHTGARVRTLRQGSPLVAVRFAPRGHLLATAGVSGTAVVWDARTGRPVAELRHRGPVSAVAFSPRGDLVATASRDGTGAVWARPTDAGWPRCAATAPGSRTSPSRPRAARWRRPATTGRPACGTRSRAASSGCSARGRASCSRSTSAATGGWPPAASTAWSASGTCARADCSTRCGDTPASSSGCASAGTAAGWSRRPTRARPASGTPAPGASALCWPGTAPTCSTPL